MSDLNGKGDAMESRYGQYALVTYEHPFRGERMNLGVLVWHPSRGTAHRFVGNPSRVLQIDEGASVERIRLELSDIERMLDDWNTPDDSPLEALSREFRRGLVVNDPMPARMQDAQWILERLSSCLLPPVPFMRASSRRQFSRAFGRRLESELRARQVTEVQTEVVERGTFQPVEITLVFEVGSELTVWRATSFSSLHKSEDQVILAKAVHAENTDLRALERYGEANLNMAVELPKSTARQGWHDAMAWLGRDADRVEVFEDRASIEQKLPALVA